MAARLKENGVPWRNRKLFILPYADCWYACCWSKVELQISGFVPWCFRWNPKSDITRMSRWQSRSRERWRRSRDAGKEWLASSMHSMTPVLLGGQRLAMVMTWGMVTLQDLVLEEAAELGPPEVSSAGSSPQPKMVGTSTQVVLHIFRTCPWQSGSGGLAGAPLLVLCSWCSWQLLGCGPGRLAPGFLNGTRTAYPRHGSTIQSCAWLKRLQGTKRRIAEAFCTSSCQALKFEGSHGQHDQGICLEHLYSNNQLKRQS